MLFNNSKNCLYIIIILFTIIFLTLISTAIILDTNIGYENISGFVLLSILISSLITIGGYLGAKLYFLTTLIFNFIGLFYMIFVSINKTAEGWSDLVSVISYLFTIFIGILLGLIIELIKIMILKRKNKN